MSIFFETMRQAVRYAKGSKSTGRLIAIPVPRDGPGDMEKARNGDGEWVRSEDMNPLTNVYGRVYRSETGALGVFYPGASVDADLWFFPRQTEERASHLPQSLA